MCEARWEIIIGYDFQDSDSQKLFSPKEDYVTFLGHGVQ